MPAISVLMPSLNVAPFIRRAVESVLNQTFDDLEVLCIDAGSTDGTLEILREYERKDPRVRVILSGQKSYGHQMNLGLREATGEFIGIVETDDFASPEMYARLYDRAKAHNAQVVKANYFDFHSFPFERERLVRRYRNYPHDTLLNEEERTRLLKGNPTLWTSIFERKLLREHRIEFLETPGASYQDTSFIIKVVLVAERIVLLDESYLHYRRDNENSSVHSRDKAFYVCDEMRSAHEFMERLPKVSPRVRHTMWSQRADVYEWNYARLGDEHRMAFLEQVRKEFAPASKAGELKRKSFSARGWGLVEGALKDPAAYYRAHREKAIRPASGDAKPLITVVQDVTCAGELLETCLEGARRQSRPDVEVFVVCANASEKARKTIASYGEKIENYRAFVDTDGSDACASVSAGSLMNAALEAAGGEWFLFLAGDCVLGQGSIEAAITRLDRPDADVYMLDVVEYDQSDRRIRKLAAKPKVSGVGAWRTSADADSGSILQRCGAHVAAKLFSRKLVADGSLRFQDTTCNYDVAFSALATLRARQVSRIDGATVFLAKGGNRKKGALLDARPTDAIMPWGELCKIAEEKDLMARFEETVVNVVADGIADDYLAMRSPAARLGVCQELCHGDLVRYGIRCRPDEFYQRRETPELMRILPHVGEEGALADGSPIRGTEFEGAYELFATALEAAGDQAGPGAGSDVSQGNECVDACAQILAAHDRLDAAAEAYANVPSEEKALYLLLPPKEQALFESLVKPRAEALAKTRGLEAELETARAELAVLSEAHDRDEKRLEKVTKSRSYKLGKALTSPVKALRKIRKR